MAVCITQTCLLLSKQHLRGTIILQWSENLIEIGIRRNVHYKTLQSFTVFNGVIYCLVDICYFEL